MRSDNYSDSAESMPLPFSGGENYEMDVVGLLGENMPYGWVNEARVIICDKIAGYKVRNPEKENGAQPGDRVLVRIDELSDKSGLATVLENHDYFLDKVNDEREIRLTNPSNRDARDAVSQPNYGGGFMGVLTFVKRARFSDGNVLVKKECWSKGRNGRYYVKAKLADPDHERPIEQEIYIARWGPYDQSIEPNFNRIRNVPGIPNDLSAVLFFGNDGEKSIIRARDKVDLSDRTSFEAVDEYYKLTEPRTRFRFATAINMEALREAIRYSSYDLVIGDELKYPWDF